MQPFNVSRLAKHLRQIRRKYKVSLNQLARLSGLSRRTLARLESGFYEVQGTRNKVRKLSPAQATEHKTPQLSPRIAMRLVRLLLPPEKIDSILRDATKLSRAYARDAGGTPDDYTLLDLLPDFYPYFLFHPPQNELDLFIRKEYAPDYRDSLHRLVIRPPRNLGLRLRAFRLRHDLTLVHTAALLGLSKSQLHRLERAERHPSAQAAYRILRLLTLPGLPGHHNFAARLKPGQAASQPGCPRPGATGEPVYPESRLVGTKGRQPPEHTDPLDSLRRLWLSSGFKTRDLAAALAISHAHLIRLLRGHRQPSKKLLQRISALLAAM